MVASSATARTLPQVASRCSGEPQSAILGVLHPPILRILADGRPATVDELAAVTSRPAEQIAEMLRRIDPIELGADGSVLGLGLTLVPTAHRVELPGRRRLLYAWCAPDAVILPSAIGASARDLAVPCHQPPRHRRAQHRRAGQCRSADRGRLLRRLTRPGRSARHRLRAPEPVRLGRSRRGLARRASRLRGDPGDPGIRLAGGCNPRLRLGHRIGE